MGRERLNFGSGLVSPHQRRIISVCQNQNEKRHKSFAEKRMSNVCEFENNPAVPA